MKRIKLVTCRYGVTYVKTFSGSAGAIARISDLMTRCCCWVCHNHDCKNPRNEKLDDCANVCSMWWKEYAPCKGKEGEK